MKKETLAKILTYLGSIPFIFLTYVAIYGNNYIALNTANTVLMAYCAIILSFISGMHFSYAILQDKISIKLLLFSNIIALASWFSLLVSFKIALVIMLICYFFNLIIDLISYRNLIIEKWFFHLRLRISGIVMACVILNLWLCCLPRNCARSHAQSAVPVDELLDLHVWMLSARLPCPTPSSLSRTRRGRGNPVLSFCFSRCDGGPSPKGSGSWQGERLLFVNIDYFITQE